MANFNAELNSLPKTKTKPKKPGPVNTLPTALAKPFAKSAPILSPFSAPNKSETVFITELKLSKKSLRAGARVRSPRFAVNSLTVVSVCVAMEERVSCSMAFF